MFFHSTCLKHRTCHKPVRPGHRKFCTFTQNHLSKPEGLMLQNATLLKKSGPWPPSISDERVSCTAPARRSAYFQLLCFWKNVIKPAPLLTFGKVQNRLCLSRETTSEPSTVVLTPCFLHILTSTCAPRHKSMHSRHLYLQTMSKPEVLCAFWLGNALRAKMACTISTSELLPKLYILTWTCPLRKKSVHFLTAQFLLSSDSFSTLIFSLLPFSSLTLLISVFHLRILSEVWLLNFFQQCTPIIMYWNKNLYFCEYTTTTFKYTDLKTVRPGWIDYLRESFPWPARQFKHTESNSLEHTL